MKIGKSYPELVCMEGGTRYGRTRENVNQHATCHEDQCGVCGNVASVTEPRDLVHLSDGWQEHKATNKESGNE